MMLLSSQGMGVSAIAKVAFTNEEGVQDVIFNFNADGAGEPYPNAGGRTPKFALPQRPGVKKIAKATTHDPGPIPGDLPLPAVPLLPTVRIAIICDNFSAHLSTADDG